MIPVYVGSRIPYINKSTKPTKGFGTETIPSVGGLHHSFVALGRFPRQIQVAKDGGMVGGAHLELVSNPDILGANN